MQTLRQGAGFAVRAFYGEDSRGQSNERIDERRLGLPRLTRALSRIPPASRAPRRAPL
jgi:hypothetical protein